MWQRRHSHVLRVSGGQVHGRRCRVRVLRVAERRVAVRSRRRWRRQEQGAVIRVCRRSCCSCCEWRLSVLRVEVLHRVSVELRLQVWRRWWRPVADCGGCSAGARLSHASHAHSDGVRWCATRVRVRLRLRLSLRLDLRLCVRMGCECGVQRICGRLRQRRHLLSAHLMSGVLCGCVWPISREIDVVIVCTHVVIDRGWEGVATSRSTSGSSGCAALERIGGGARSAGRCDHCARARWEQPNRAGPPRGERR